MILIRRRLGVWGLAPSENIKKTVQYTFFKIPSSGGEESEKALNLFLRTHRIVTVSKEYENSCWSFCVEYIPIPQTVEQEPVKSSIDYKDVLSDEDFMVYAKLRDIRKRISLEAGVPVYSIATNAQLARMVQDRCTTVGALQRVPGFGDGKRAKYGEVFLSILNEAFHEKSG